MYLLRLIILINICALVTISAVAQQKSGNTVSGQIGDPIDKIHLSNVVVMVLQAKDSILVKHARSDREGKFKVPALDSGQYLLVVNHPDYAEFSRTFELSGRDHNLGEIPMTLKSKLIEEVVIQGVRPITINGDTTEFDPRAFNVDPNAKVEELIKKFPGIQVDANGKITAFGENIERVLVDGEEFFGNDPVLVTRNIRADMVSKVQLYDKRSEETEFTGVDDGSRQKTLNFVLQEDKKKGYFGKAVAGATHNGLYQLQGMANRFDEKLRFSVYATHSTTNLSGLSGSDMFSLFGMDGGIQGVTVISGGGIVVSGGGVGGGGSGAGGIPKIFNSGLYLSNKTPDGKLNYSFDYKANNNRTENYSRTLIQDFLPGGTQFSTQVQNSDSRNLSHTFGTKFRWRPDSLTMAHLNIETAWNKSEQMGHNDDFTLSETQDTLNISDRLTDNISEGKNLRTTFMLHRNLAKKGSNMSLTFNQNYTENLGNGSLVSAGRFYAPNGELLFEDNLDQRKLQNSKNLDLNANLNYSLPIVKDLNWNVSATSGMTRLDNDNFSWNRLPNSAQESLDSLYSNDLLTNTFKYGVGNQLSYSKKDFYMIIGGGINKDHHKREDFLMGEDFARNFVSTDYSLMSAYTLPGNRRFNLSVSGRSAVPRLEQLQPLKQNSNPLYIQTGNMGLEQSYNHTLSLSFDRFSLLTSRFLNFRGNIGFTNRPIVQNSSTDELGRTVYFFQNLAAYQPFNYSLSGNINQQVKFLKSHFGTDINWNSNTNYSMINEAVNAMDNQTLRFGLSLSAHNLKVVDYRLSVVPSYVIQKSSLQPETNNDGWNFGSDASLTIRFPAKIKLYTDGNYSFQPATAAFSEELHRLLINMSLEKSFLKNESLVLNFAVNDLLNDGTGFDRNASQNRIVQQERNYLGRYFLLSMKWDFNIMGK